WQPFTTSRVNSDLNGLKSTVVHFRDEIAAANASKPKISSALSSAESRLASTNVASQRLVLQTQVRGLQAKLAKEDQLIANKERDIPDVEKQIASMEKLIETGNQLRSITQLNLRVAVKTNDGDFDLLRTETE